MWLAIDTATDRLSVALGTASGTALEENLAGARRHAAALLPMIDSLLERAAVRLGELTGVALSDGPGSFTGLRVGAAVAKALVHTRGFPLWVAPSLMVRAAGAAVEGNTVLATANALRGEVFAAAYRFERDRILTVLAPGVYRPDALEGCGDVTAPADVPPHAARLIDLIGRPGGAVRVDDVQRWQPVYGRPAEAQARWEMTHGRPLPNSAGSPG